MGKDQERPDSDPAAIDHDGGGNGNGRPDEVDEAEFFLVPLLATDPLPYLFDGEGNPVNADGDQLTNGNGVPKAIRKLQDELRPRRESSDG
jgi:hypothetical protein